MQYKLTCEVSALNDYDALVVAVVENQIDPAISRIDQGLANELSVLFTESGGLEFSRGCGYEVFDSSQVHTSMSIILLYFDDPESLSYKTLNHYLSEIITQLRQLDKQSVLLCLSMLRLKQTKLPQHYQLLAQFCEMSVFERPKNNQVITQQCSNLAVTFYETNKRQTESINQAIKYGVEIGRGLNYSKQISNLPANLCTPDYLAKQALELANQSALTTTVLNEKDMELLEMNCILAVSKGSAQSAKLIVMHYQGTRNSQKPIVLIGKGLTFDSGGYSLKSAPQMDEMKFDMSAGACVMATMQVVASLNLPVNLIAIVPCSENLINGRAFKPGDILNSMSGQTIEVLSTDAEGRLLLADCLTYAQRYQPDLVIDVATLTGACITALGHEISGLMSNDKNLSRQLIKAGQMSTDYVWPLPLWEDYQTILESNFADMASSAGRDGNAGAGAIVAGVFLSKFARHYRWAHLDVAGAAWLRGKNKGSTGRPLPLLCQFILNYVNASS